MNVLIFLVLLFIYNGFLCNNKKCVKLNINGIFHFEFGLIYANLEACCNGGILIVCSLGVSNQVVPAGKHFPTKSELSFICTITSFICVSSHPVINKITGEMMAPELQ